MIYNEQILSEINALEKSIADKKAFLAKAPAGRLECHKSNNTFIWRVTTKDDQGKTKTKYIKKSDREMAEKLALKGLYECELQDEKKELRALQSYLRNHSKFDRKEKYLTRSAAYVDLLNNHFSKNFPDAIEDWLNKPSQELAPKPEMRKFRCRNGLMVRSKSEQIIATMLFARGIPFKYEYPLSVGNKTYFPDFTIMNPRTQEIFIWEHFGMMDKDDYADNCFEKLRHYNRNGYTPTKNLITTFETRVSGVDEQELDMLINKFLI